MRPFVFALGLFACASPVEPSASPVEPSPPALDESATEAEPIEPALEAAWSALLGAMRTADPERVAALGGGCADGARPVALGPPAGWPALADDWERRGLRVDRARDPAHVHASVAPLLPSMPTIDLERRPDGSLAVCAIRPGG